MSDTVNMAPKYMYNIQEERRGVGGDAEEDLSTQKCRGAARRNDDSHTKYYMDKKIKITCNS